MYSSFRSGTYKLFGGFQRNFFAPSSSRQVLHRKTGDHPVVGEATKKDGQDAFAGIITLLLKGHERAKVLVPRGGKSLIQRSLFQKFSFLYFEQC